ncbi:hypothetical protein [Brevundimonas sp. NIBR10]|uniref:capsular polysaccharide export protein, LipB/KpsS family n=1 Tax=Brevundimonas sp. NIBR10 TaxID=3015997 RepID=UPI0022F16544|nr:hypothetical protein [Brevundimonas sp. NIBR10]
MTDSAEKSSFLRLNAVLTEVSLAKARSGGRVIYVDLMHDNVHYQMRSLVIGRAVAHLLGLPLVGIVGNPGVVRRSAYLRPKDVDLKLIRSFGVRKIIRVPQSLPSTPASEKGAEALRKIIGSRLEGEVVPAESIRALTAMCDGAVHLGRFLHGTVLRSQLMPELIGGPWLDSAIDDFARLDDWLCRQFLDQPPAAFVTGHADYAPWGLAIERAIAAGGVGVHFHVDVRLPIYLLRRNEPGLTLHGQMRRADAHVFGRFQKHVGKSRSAARFAAVRHGRAYELSKNWRWVGATQAAQPSWPFEDGLPCVCLFTQTFTDQPSSDESVFVDYLEWVEATLDHAATHGGYNLLIKVHPYDGNFDLAFSINRLEAEYANCPNIAFARTQIPHAELAQKCVLGLTVRGTPGLEMVAEGLPMLLAGHGTYSDLGLAQVARDVKDYFDRIERAVARSRRKTLKSTARMYMAWNRILSPTSSGFLGPFDISPPNAAFWERAASGVHATTVEADELTQTLARGWQDGPDEAAVRLSSPALDQLVERWSHESLGAHGGSSAASADA